MNFEKIYHPVIQVKTKSILSGEYESGEHYADKLMQENPILKAFVEDHDIQEITVVSTNIGFIRTFTKRYKQQEAV